MCRFVLYMGKEITVESLITEPDNSLIHQSAHSKELAEPLNGDGFGMAWYVPDMTDEPAVFKDITPAWNNTNLLNLARVTKSSCVLAHVRAATPGFPVIQLNCHPFTYGNLSFMHNGKVKNFHKLRRALIGRLSEEAFQSIGGSTDTEHIFALFIDNYKSISDGESCVETMSEALKRTLKNIEELLDEASIEGQSNLNLAVSDGKCAVSSRYSTGGPDEPNSLYIHTGGSFDCREGHYHMQEPDSGNRAVLVASEPLDEDSSWTRVPPNAMVLVSSELSVEMRPI